MPSSPFSPSTTQHPNPKLNITTAPVPSYISPTQPPTKRPPFSVINSVPFIRSTALILPLELYDLIIPHLPESLLSPKYANSIAPLSKLLQGPFFNDCIKRPGSNLLLLSEGTPGVDDKFSLHNGKLSLDLGKEVYQRSGLQGVVSRDGGRKHVAKRWRVEYDLRSAASVEGKKGFEKVRGACAEKGVLGKGACWLGVDVETLGGGEVWESEGGKGLFARVCEGRVGTRDVKGVLVPDILMGEVESVEEDEWWEVVEWLDLVALGSPRVEQRDAVDPYVSRYSVPEPSNKQDLRILKWEGLMSSDWTTKLVIEIIKQSRIRKCSQWAALSVVGHETEAVGNIDGYSIVLQPGESVTSDENPRTLEQPQEQQDVMELDRTEKNGQTRNGTGLQSAVCFQFIDSVIS